MVPMQVEALQLIITSLHSAVKIISGKMVPIIVPIYKDFAHLSRYLKKQKAAFSGNCAIMKASCYPKPRGNPFSFLLQHLRLPR
jgi:hypothetical protein